MIQFSGNCSGFPDFFRIFPDILKIFRFQHFLSFFKRIDGIYLEYDMIFFSESSSFSRIFPDFSGFFLDLHIPAFLTIFLYRIYGLLLKNYMINLYQSSFRISSFWIKGLPVKTSRKSYITDKFLSKLVLNLPTYEHLKKHCFCYLSQFVRSGRTEKYA